mgnify:FL=1
MSYAFKKIGATSILENAPDNANVVCEVNGEVNRVPATKIGGGGIKVAIIKDTGSGLSCDNMTYEEAVEYLTNGVPFLIFLFNGAEYMIARDVYYDGTSTIEVRATNTLNHVVKYEWTSAGITDVTVN